MKQLTTILEEIRGNPFTNSKVSDIVYHGTVNEFDTFELKGERGGKMYGDGYYFTDNLEYATSFGNIILKCYIDVQNPFKMYDIDKKDYKRLFDAMKLHAKSKDQQSTLKRARNAYRMGYYHSVYKRAIQGKLVTADDLGFDSLMMYADYDTGGYEYMVYDNNQINVVGKM